MDVIKTDGSSLEGWPYGFEDSTFSSSPILHDVDWDGLEDVVNVDRDGIIRVMHVAFPLCSNF